MFCNMRHALTCHPLQWVSHGLQHCSGGGCCTIQVSGTTSVPRVIDNHYYSPWFLLSWKYNRKLLFFPASRSRFPQVSTQFIISWSQLVTNNFLMMWPMYVARLVLFCIALKIDFFIFALFFFHICIVVCATIIFLVWIRIMYLFISTLFIYCLSCLCFIPSWFLACNLLTKYSTRCMTTGNLPFKKTCPTARMLTTMTCIN